MPRLLAIAALSLLAASPAAAAPVEDLQIWANLTAMGSLGGKSLYFLEAQPRFTAGASRMSALLLRGAVGYQVTPSFGVYAGFLHMPQPVRNGRDQNEQRPFVQTSWTLGKVAGGTLSNRTRLEIRFPSTGRDTGWRVRSMVRYVHPLGAPARPRALVSVEPFVALNDTDWGVRSGVDQVRSFAGLEIPLRGRSTLEIGYLNQAVNAHRAPNRLNHVASIALFVRP